ncbi:hypothetical protein OIE68_08295 [Nocardia vinacea]|uniref:hypothetical protein n=1 Tax=Nocardia vinacea TaxID=96468 RepID=UPI002E0E1B46|nr:hypothetical protein OIE68_08295 [Nocardia vinacea]
MKTAAAATEPASTQPIPGRSNGMNTAPARPAMPAAGNTPDGQAMRRHLGTCTGQGRGAGNAELGGGTGGIMGGGALDAGLIGTLDGFDHILGGLDHTLGELAGAFDAIPDDVSAVPLDGTPRSAVDVPVGSPDSGCTTPSLVESDVSDACSADDAADASTAPGTESPLDSAEVGASPTYSDVDRVSDSDGVLVSAEESAAFGASAAASARAFGSDIAAGWVGDSGCDGSDWSGIGIPPTGVRDRPGTCEVRAAEHWDALRGRKYHTDPGARIGDGYGAAV